MNIKLEQYKIFNETCKTLSFSKAARNLFISQSAISQTINNLEKELNVQLFIRKSKGVALTEEGALLYKYIDEALSLINNAENALSSISNLSEGEITIGSGDDLVANFLVDVIDLFHQKYPNIKIRAINRTSLEINEMLKNNQLDIGFTNKIISDDLVSRKYLTIHDILVGSKKDDHIYTNEQIATLPLIMLEESSSTRNYLETYFKKKGFELNSVIELGAHDLLLDFVKRNFGYAFVIEEFAHKYLENNLIYKLNLKENLPTRNIYYCYPNHRILKSSTIEFIKILESLTK